MGIFLWLITSTLITSAQPITPKRVFFHRDQPESWRSCYVPPLDEALAFTRGPDFQSLASVVLSALPRTDQENQIVIQYQNPTGSGADVVRRLPPCPFSYADQTEVIECQVSVINNRYQPPVEYLSEQAISLHRQLRSHDPSLLHIDCDAMVLNPIRNRWTQQFRRSDVKIMSYLRSQNHPVSPRTARGLVTEGGSLLPHQWWSAQLAFNFMEDLLQNEGCDASVDEITLVTSRSHWSNQAWCPWGLRVIELTCHDATDFDDSQLIAVPLSPRAGEIQNFCANENKPAARESELMNCPTRSN
jgi:hypothetical protein